VSPVKLPRLRRAPAPEPAQPAAPALQVLAYARTGLPDEEISAQTETLHCILSYDGETRR
jgi:hypothetical protein